MAFKVGEKALVVCRPELCDAKYRAYIGATVTIKAINPHPWFDYEIELEPGLSCMAKEVALQKLPPPPPEKSTWEQVEKDTGWNPTKIPDLVAHQDKLGAII